MAVRFNYEQTIQQAKLLDELAAQMQNQCCKRMDQVYQNVQAAWTGEAAKGYLKYTKGVQDDLSKKAAYLREVAEFLRVAAKKIRAADEAAQKAAQTI